MTLIGEKLAKKGLKFIHEGGAEECVKCMLRKICVEKLKKGRAYEIVNVRRKKHLCPVHGKVVVVEVRYTSIEAAIKSRFAIENMIVRFSPVKCNEECKFKSLCQPEGLYDGDRVKIEKLMGKIDCPRKLKLIRAKLILLPD